MEIGDINDQTVRTGPLSYGQRALWFLQQLSPDNCAYNIGVAVRVSGELDADLLKASFQHLIDRHESLRSVFPSSRGKPIQFVPERCDVDFVQIDASMSTLEDLKANLSEECQKPFDLENGPVFRVTAFGRSPLENVILLVVHHIAVDYFSVQQVLRELGMVYSAAKRGVGAELPANSLGCLDYAKWQNEMLDGPDGTQLWEYWSRQLSGDLPVINLPFDRPRREMQTFGGDTLNVDFDRQLTRDVRRLAQSLNGSIFTCLLAAFFCMLHKVTGQNDILAGSPPIGRRRPEFEGVVGFFHNPVVLRSRWHSGQSFTAFHGSISQTVQEALEHQEFPFAHLVEKIKPVRHPSYSPIFQVMFVFYEKGIDDQSTRMNGLGMGEMNARLELGGLEVEYLEIEEPVSMLDLTVTVVEEVESMSAGFQYNSDLFDRATVESLAEAFTSVLAAAAGNPEFVIDLFADSPGSPDSRVSAGEEVQDRARIRRQKIKQYRLQRSGSFDMHG